MSESLHYCPATGHCCPLLSRAAAEFPVLATHLSFAVSPCSHHYRALFQLCCSQSLLSLLSFARLLQVNQFLHGCPFPGKLSRKLSASRICTLDDLWCDSWEDNFGNAGLWAQADWLKHSRCTGQPEPSPISVTTIAEEGSVLFSCSYGYIRLNCTHFRFGVFVGQYKFPRCQRPVNMQYSYLVH